MTQAQELENLNMLRESGLISDKDYQLQYDIIHKKYNALPEPDFGMHDYTCMWFRKAFTWKGRATRSEFWWPQVEIFLVILVLSIMLFLGFPFVIALMVFPLSVGLISLILWIFSMWAGIAYISATVRRFHDLGLNAWVAMTPWIVSGIKWVLIISGFITLVIIGDALDFKELTLAPNFVFQDLNTRFSSFIKTIIALNILDFILTIIWLIICALPSKKEVNQYGAPKVK